MPSATNSVPQLQFPGIGRENDGLSVRSEGRELGTLRRCRKFSQVSAVLNVPQVDRTAIMGRQSDSTIGGERQAQYQFLVRRQGRLFAAGCRVPEMQRTVLTTSDQCPAIGSEGEPRTLVLPRPPRLAVGEI